MASLVPPFELDTAIMIGGTAAHTEEVMLMFYIVWGCIFTVITLTIVAKGGRRK
ncbi:hypothetical protein [Paenibacillus xanthanilyticus]|uniref:Uncharacterized protein n=1 Tax=Paenibacillus xanthanilyticus TaxID=1783531 RepID=A0ABV8KAG5_9BACL